MSLTRIKEGLALAIMAVTSVTAGASCSQGSAFADDPVILEDPAPVTGGTLLLLDDIGRAVVSAGTTRAGL